MFYKEFSQSYFSNEEDAIVCLYFLKFLNIKDDIPILFETKTFVISLLFIDANYCSYLLKYYLNDEVSYLEKIILTIFKNPEYKEFLNNNIINYIKTEISNTFKTTNSSNQDDKFNNFLVLGRIYTFFNKYQSYLLNDDNLKFVEDLQNELPVLDHQASYSLLFLLFNKSSINNEKQNTLLERYTYSLSF